MTSLNEARLITCFKKTFPEIKSGFTTLGQDTCSEWDSISVVQLILAIEQEFKITVDLDQIDRFTSYSNIYTYLKEVL